MPVTAWEEHGTSSLLPSSGKAPGASEVQIDLELSGILSAAGALTVRKFHHEHLADIGFSMSSA